MKHGDLSESNAIKPVDHSKLVNILVHALAVISGVIGFFVAYAIYFFMPFRPQTGFFGSQIIFGLVFFVTFLVLGALFGFMWNKGGWKLGLSLGTLIAIVLGYIFLLDVFSGKVSFEEVVQVTLHILPVLAGGCLGAYLGANYKQRQRTNNGVV